jgi:hypothetical protein
MKFDLVHLVCLVQPNKRDRPDKQERPAESRALRFDRLTVLSHVEGRARSIDADGTFHHPVREGIDQLLKMFQGEIGR